MTIEDRLKKIGDCDIKIIKSEIVKDAKLVIFKFDEFDTSAAIIYNTGELFHLKDWQEEFLQPRRISKNLIGCRKMVKMLLFSMDYQDS